MNHTITKILIWLGFIAFLSTSIPHVAWVFHTFEGDDGSTPWWWMLSYLEAISIDVLIAWLSHVLTSGKETGDKRMGYVFIIILVGISWFFNWLYAKSHAPVEAGIWSHVLFNGWIPLGTVTPLITSALPVFAIGYALMLSRLTTTLTPEALRKQLEARKALAAIREEYAVKGRFARAIKGSITQAKAVIDHAEATFHQGVDATENQFNTEEIPIVEQSNSDPSLMDAMEEERDVPHAPSDTQYDSPQTSLPSGRSVSLEDAALALACEVSVVKRYLSAGKLKSSSGSPNYVTRASLDALVASKRRSVRKQFIPTPPHSRNGHDPDTEALALPLLIVDAEEE